MTTPSRATAPDIRPGYPSDFPRLRRAWDYCWIELSRGDWLAAPELAHAAANQISPPLTDGATRTVLRYAVAAGLIERQLRMVHGDRGARRVAFYRLCRA